MSSGKSDAFNHADLQKNWQQVLTQLKEQNPMAAINAEMIHAINQRVLHQEAANLGGTANQPGRPLDFSKDDDKAYRVFKHERNGLKMVIRGMDALPGYELYSDGDTFEASLAVVNGTRPPNPPKKK